MLRPLIWGSIVLACCCGAMKLSGAGSGQQFWLGGKYDGSKIIVYFDVVSLKGWRPQGAIVDSPANTDFLQPHELTPDAVARLIGDSQAMRFKLGDQFDILDGGGVYSITLERLVGTDCGHGAQYCVGAIASGPQEILPLLADFYVVTRPGVRTHGALTAGAPTNRFAATREQTQTPDDFARNQALAHPSLALDEALGKALTAKMKQLAPSGVRDRALRLSPELSLRTFYASNGAVRYYAVAQWIDSTNNLLYVLGAWVAVSPTLKILSYEPPTVAHSEAADALIVPTLLTYFVNIANNQTGILVGAGSEPGLPIRLLLYRDGVSSKEMTCLAELSAEGD